MANTWHETVAFVGRPDDVTRLREIVRVETRPNGSTGVCVYIDDQFQTYGHLNECESTPWNLRISAEMRRKPVAFFFREISARVPNLWMTSSSAGILDDRYALVAGFGPKALFQANEAIFERDYEPLPAEDMARIKSVWKAFSLTEQVALRSFRRGARTPANAIRLMQEAKEAYIAAGGVTH